METSAESADLVLHEYLHVLRRRRWIVIGVVLVVVVGALALSFSQQKVYRATAELLLQHRSTENLFDALKDIGDPSRLPQTEMKVIQSQPVRAEVERRIGMAPGISASQAGSADIIEVSAQHTDPATAAKIADTYAQAYIDYRRTQAVDDILAASKQIQAKIDELQKEIDVVEGEARGAGPQQSPAAGAILAARSEGLRSQQNVFKEKLNQLQVATALNSGGAQLVNPASIPTSPVRPKPLTDGVLAGAVGLILGVGLAFLLEYLDDSIKTKEHLERVIGNGIPVFGLIPPIERGDVEVDSALVAPTSGPAEAYRALRTAVQFLGVDRPKVLQVTSASLSEGKTTTVANLAAVFARAGAKVVLADCDLRRPRVHTFFNLAHSPGLTSILLGEVAVNEGMKRIAGAGGLYVLPSGTRPPNPSELLGSLRMTELLRNLKSGADIVLVDSPPLLPVTDASVLAGRVDGVLLVVMAGTTTRRPLQRAVELLRQMQAPIVGVVLTKAGGDTGYGYGYGYGYQEHDDEPTGRRRRRRGTKSPKRFTTGPDEGERVVS